MATGRVPPPELAFSRGTEAIAPIVEEHGHWGLRVRAGGRNAACRVCRLPLALKRPRELVAFPCGHWCGPGFLLLTPTWIAVVVGAVQSC